jgi:hypothetical protein
MRGLNRWPARPAEPEAALSRGALMLGKPYAMPPWRRRRWQASRAGWCLDEAAKSRIIDLFLRLVLSPYSSSHGGILESYRSIHNKCL